MLSIVLLGTGNVATHLFQAFQNTKEVEIIEVFGRNTSALAYFDRYTHISNDIAKIADADIYILAVSDSSISEVSRALKKKKGLVVHSSGSVPLDAIASSRGGVFYPLQTFTKGKKVDFSEVPICIETKKESDIRLLELLGEPISKQVHQISSEQRKKLHLGAVLVNNFPNHLYNMAYGLCTENNIPFGLLWPLISETVDKIRHLSPKEAQTGPARRNDVKTMQEHLEQLQDPIQKKIYQLLSESIKTTYEEEL